MMASGAAPSSSEEMIPLQRLLLSAEASRLSFLDVKHIIGKIACELDFLHGLRVLHRHVSVSTVTVPRAGRGKLWASRLSPHAANVLCERGASAHCGVESRGMEPYLAPELAVLPAHRAGGRARARRRRCRTRPPATCGAWAWCCLCC
ncbi:hypothetical protein QBZ16_001378 [Prototheca wickerhamii]|uniref:Protein kinase domain-containing protein n=1 Tax=Prototheca wickerhamii TaxID=3111 RepID=A0AAD9IGW9_PROWI|nr:hypothetical protein QBZ16_001378 [Prototheca wickerhamii]